MMNMNAGKKNQSSWLNMKTGIIKYVFRYKSMYGRDSKKYLVLMFNS